jgi:signal transduction histidine kinase
MLEVLDFNPEPEVFAVDDAVTAIVQRIRAAERNAEIDVIVETPGLRVELPREVLELALDELVQNAVHAPRPTGRTRHVEVVVDTDRKKSGQERPRITISDNGSGIPEKLREDLFITPQSTKGRIGFGLILTRQLMRLVRGDVQLAATGEHGTKFEVLLSANGTP